MDKNEVIEFPASQKWGLRMWIQKQSPQLWTLVFFGIGLGTLDVLTDVVQSIVHFL